MNKKTLISLLIAVALCAALMIVAPGCGGGGGSNPAPAVKTASGTGKVAAAVKFTGRQNGRALAQTTDTSVTVTITISGYYGEDDSEFQPISTSVTVNPSQGSVTIQVLDVPIGRNHLLVAEADWGTFTETLKVIIPIVIEGETVTATANEETTAVANAAIYYVEQHGITLADLDAGVLDELEQAVQALHASGIPYYEMTPQAIADYAQSMNVPAGVTVSPASATVVAGGTYQFDIAVVDANGNAIATLDPQVSVDPATLGTIDVTGLFTAQTAGTGVLTATYESFSATAALTVISTCATAADCGDGNALTIDACANAGTPSAACTHTAIACNADTDCNDSNALTIDACANGGTASAVCSHTAIACNTDVDCSFGTPVCLSGGTAASLCVACSGDTDCNDGNALTADTCSNASTASSSCAHSAYACNTAADCSAPANVCINPGALNSACIACSTAADCDTSAPLCSGGGTVSSFCYACDTDADCDDGDPANIDTCFNGGTATAVCGHSTDVVSGNITADETWSLAGSPYIVQGQINVDPGVTLTIEPGTQIAFLSPGSGTDFFGNGAPEVGGIRVEGTLNAIGTVDQPISIMAMGGGGVARVAAVDIVGLGGGYWGGIYFDGNDAGGELQYINMAAPSTAIVLSNTINTIPISNINISGATDTAGGQMTSYHAFVKTARGWQETGVAHYGLRPEEKILNLAGALPNADGTYTVRIQQVGAKTAQIDAVELLAGDSALRPVALSDTAGGQARLYKVAAVDNDLIDATGRTFDVTFPAPADATGLALALTAREEPEGALASARPFFFPANSPSQKSAAGASYQTYVMDSHPGALSVDGELMATDALPAPLFIQAVRPDSGHPDGAVFGYMKNDGRFLYAALDFTPDNTYDFDEDYATLHVRVGNELKHFRVDVDQTRFGSVGFTYTDKVGYQHKVYEFRVPLSEIGSPAPGQALDVIFEAYGTASMFQATVEATFAYNVNISNVSIAYDPGANSILTLNLGELNGMGTHSISNFSATDPPQGVIITNVTDLTMSNISLTNMLCSECDTFTMNSVSDSTVDSLEMLSVDAGPYITNSTNISLSNVLVETNNYEGLYVDYSDAVSVDGLQVTSMGSSGLAYIYASTNVNIANAVLSGNTYYGASGLTYEDSTGAVTSSDLSYNTGPGFRAMGSSTNVTLTNCTVSTNCKGIVSDMMGTGPVIVVDSNVVDNIMYGAEANSSSMGLSGVFLAGNAGESSGVADLSTNTPDSSSSPQQYAGMFLVENPRSSAISGLPTSSGISPGCF